MEDFSILKMRLSIIYILPLILVIESTPVMTKSSLRQKNTHTQFCANGIRVKNNFYVIEETRNISGIPADICVHWKTENIYFTLISEDMKMNLQVLHDGELETIKVAGLGQSSTVDNLNDIVYLATDNGVYKYKEDGTIELFSALGVDVMYLAVSYNGKEMYIATWPQNRVQKITLEGTKIEPFLAIPNGHGLTLDPKNNIYFVALKTTYILKMNSKVPIKIKGLPDDKMTNVFVSMTDDVYAMDENSNLYSIDAENAKAKLLGNFNVEGVNSFAIDKFDNILIGIKGAIVKYKYYEKDPCGDIDTDHDSNKAKGIKAISSAEVETASIPPAPSSKKQNAKKRNKIKKTTTVPPTTTEYDEEEKADEDTEV